MLDKNIDIESPALIVSPIMPVGLKHSVALWILLAILGLSTAGVFHTDLDGRYHPSCPACQLEHNPGLHTSAVSSATVVAAPVVLFFVRDISKARAKQLLRSLELVPRGPPQYSN
jgi:hypothetical protein